MKPYNEFIVEFLQEVKTWQAKTGSTVQDVSLLKDMVFSELEELNEAIQKAKKLPLKDGFSDAVLEYLDVLWVQCIYYLFAFKNEKQLENVSMSVAILEIFDKRFINQSFCNISAWSAFTQKIYNKLYTFVDLYFDSDMDISADKVIQNYFDFLVAKNNAKIFEERPEEKDGFYISKSEYLGKNYFVYRYKNGLFKDKIAKTDASMAMKANFEVLTTP